MHEKEEQQQWLWRRQPAAKSLLCTRCYNNNNNNTETKRSRVFCSILEFLRKFADSLTICNYNLPSTINTWFRLKFCRRKATLIVFTRQSTHSLAIRIVFRYAIRAHVLHVHIRYGNLNRIETKCTATDGDQHVSLLYMFLERKSTIIRCNLMRRRIQTDKYMYQWRSGRVPFESTELHFWYNFKSKRFSVSNSVIF